jgi:hypothetical protein
MDKGKLLGKKGILVNISNTVHIFITKILIVKKPYHF